MGFSEGVIERDRVFDVTPISTVTSVGIGEGKGM